MLHKIASKWWVFLIRGIAAILFGIGAIAWPGITLAVLIIMYGAFALADGVTCLIIALTGGSQAIGRSWWEMLLAGVLGVGAGVATFAWPGLTALILLYIIAFWAIARGVLEIVAAIQLRKLIDHEWVLGLAGLTSVLFGVLMLLKPGAGALTVILLIGSFAIATGILLIALALRLRDLLKRHPAAP